MYVGKTQKSGADFTFLPSILDNIAWNIMAGLQRILSAYWQMVICVF